MHLLTSSQVIRNEEQSRAENGEISPLFLRLFGYSLGSGSALNGLSPSRTLLADVLLPLPSVNITYCTLLPSLNPSVSTLKGNIQHWVMEATRPQEAATTAQSWAGWKQLPAATCFRNALYPHPFLLPLSSPPCCAFCLDTENNPREQIRLENIERQKIKIKQILTAISSPIPFAVRTARWAARPWEGMLVHREMWCCWSWLPAITAHQTAPWDGNRGPSLQLETAPFAFHLWRSLFLAIQHADNVNNANNIFKKQKKKHQVSGRMQNFSASFFGWGVRGGNLVMLYLNPLKHNIFEVANWQIHSINYKWNNLLKILEIWVLSNTGRLRRENQF